MKQGFLIVSAFLLLFSACRAQESSDSGPFILVVTADPDDEAMFGATMYRVTHALGGSVDLALVTDGAGGYRFSTLAEAIYNLDLTDQDVARTHLPAIRKKELMAAGAIVGIRNYFFLDQPDQGRTDDQDSIMTYVWDADFVAGRLDHILKKESYDFVFTHLPIKPFHSHHKAATILAIQAVGRIPEDRRPVILGSFVTGMMDDVVSEFTELEGHPETRIRKDAGPYVFDRDTPLGLDDRLNYNIIVNWLIAEHKSQGTMQLFLGNTGVERFWVYDMNVLNAEQKTEEFMRRVQSAPLSR
ncbi:MAG: PIG-L family deacetylase [Bacteroidetes bacterium]|nr:MAG: PIG-L family deacetylase [Bacteroidota bacterium]